MLSLRRSAESDLPAVLAWERDPGTARWLGETGPAWHARALADPTQAHLTAVVGGVPVGFVVLARLEDPDVELRRLVVDPARRGGGHGRALLRAALAEAGARGAAGVWLDVVAANHRARALYAAEGFTATHRLGRLVYLRRGLDQNGSGIHRCDSRGGRS